jgi:hypothetical protein
LFVAVIVLTVTPPTITPHPFLKDKGKRIKDETGNGLAAPTIAARYKN